MTELPNLDGLAADYVLGQLDPADRAAVAARLAREADLAAAVAAWERRLAPLSELTRSIPPATRLFDAIERRIATGGASGEAAGDAKVVDLAKRLRRWRGVAGLTGAVAASLAIVLALREAQRSERPDTLVAVLQKDAASPAFILTVDLATNVFTVRSIAPAPQSDKSYELWLVSDKFPAPKSLGLVGRDTFDTGTGLAGVEPAVVSNATFAVSVEPNGGSPTGLPTGPVVYAGKLVKATP